MVDHDFLAFLRLLICSICSPVIVFFFFGRPSLIPFFLAVSSPALIRSEIISVSNSAKDPKIFKNIPYGKSALAPLLRGLIKDDKVSGSVHNGYWHDIGTPQRLEDINKAIH